MMEAERTSETSVKFYQTTQRNIPEDSHLHTRRSENLKSQLLLRLKMIMNIELIRIWKESVEVDFKLIFRCSYEEIGEIQQRYET
jgi:hypothetical protein